MEDEQRRSLETRVAELEKTLHRVEQQLEKHDQIERARAAATSEAAIKELSRLRRKRTGTLDSTRTGLLKLLDGFRNTEGWIGKVGIGLLLFGLVILFKYAIDQGWLTPTVRILFGLVLGALLLLFSAWLYKKRRPFSLLLFGGGIVAFYVTGFAAFQVFELVSYPVALIYMVAVTALSFAVSVRQSEAFPSLLGAIGGFLTPFLLWVEPLSIPALVAYACILITCALVVYYYRGWRPLFWLTFVGGGLVLFTGLGNGFAFTNEPILAARIPMQLSIVYAWLMFSILPIAREVVASVDGSKLLPTSSGMRTKEASELGRRNLNQHLQLFIPIVAISAFLMSTPIWSLLEKEWGWIAFVFSMLYGIAAFAMYNRDSVKNFTMSHGVAAVILFTIALTIQFEDHLLILLITVEATVLHLFAHRYNNKALHVGGYILFGIVGFVMLERLSQTDIRVTDILNPRALTDLMIFGLALTAAFRLPTVRLRSLYRVLVHLAFLGWFIREMDQMLDGQGLITICWGVYAVLLVVAGLRLNNGFVRALGVGTLLLVVGKLFLVDLSALETIWRIVLFLGFGGVFLLLSYFFRTLWRKDPVPDKHIESGPGISSETE